MNAPTSDRRAPTQSTEKGRDSHVADNEPRHIMEAMHRKEGTNLNLKLILIITNDRDAQT